MCWGQEVQSCSIREALRTSRPSTKLRHAQLVIRKYRDKLQSHSDREQLQMMIDSPPFYLSEEAGVVVAAEPPTECEIRLPRWCIAGFDGRMEATDNGKYRIWALHSRLYMKDGPLLIVEDKTCNDRNDTAPPRELPRQSLTADDGREYLSATFVIGATEGCKLEFRMPWKGARADPTYEQLMRFGILICTGDICKSTLGKFPEP